MQEDNQLEREVPSVTWSSGNHDKRFSRIDPAIEKGRCTYYCLEFGLDWSGLLGAIGCWLGKALQRHFHIHWRWSCSQFQRGATITVGRFQRICNVRDQI